MPFPSKGRNELQYKNKLKNRSTNRNYTSKIVYLSSLILISALLLYRLFALLFNCYLYASLRDTLINYIVVT